MQNNYYDEIYHLIKKLETNKKSRVLQGNSEAVLTYWHIGKILFDAQGGNERAKYGNELIKKWSTTLTKSFGKGYDTSNLKRFRQFYTFYPKGGMLCHQLNWSHYRYLLPIKDENKRNYYINEIIKNNLSIRELRELKKSNAYERLLNKPEKIEIIDNDYSFDLKDSIKNPILIKLNKNESIMNEKDLELLLLAKLKNFFLELGQGFTLVGNDYKITYGAKNYYIDILLFNYLLNAFVVVELKTRKLEKEDKAQIQFYMKYVDNKMKQSFHNKTIGIIVSKEQDKYIVSFVSDANIIPITYKTTQEINS